MTLTAILLVKNMIDFLITTPSINVCDALLYNINLIMDKLDSRCNLSDICCNATFAVTAHTVDAIYDDVIRLHIDESGDIGMMTCADEWFRSQGHGRDHYIYATYHCRLFRAL